MVCCTEFENRIRVVPKAFCLTVIGHHQNKKETIKPNGVIGESKEDSYDGTRVFGGLKEIQRTYWTIKKGLWFFVYHRVMLFCIPILKYQ